MSQKESQKKVEPLIEEEKDFYLSYLNKKLRNIRKKLDQINELSKKDPNTLKPEQLEKVNSKAEVTENIKHYEELKEMYYAAYKESKQTQKESSIEKGSQNQAVSASKKETGFDEESRKAYKEEVVKDTIKKVLDFISISQILGNSSKKDEFSRLYEAETKDLNQLNGIQELHQQIFDFVESSESTKMEERVNQSMDKLARYINADDQVAINDKTYKAIQENVESIANLAFFKNLTFATQVQEEVQTNNTAVNNVQEESSIHVSTAAAILKPDIDDFVHSPEKGRYLPKEPKVVRFVDEIERDMQSSQTKQRAQDTSSHSSGEGVQVAKESREPLAPTEAEELNQEPQEQKSFRRNRGNNGSGYKKPRNNDYNNSNNNSQPNRGYSNQRKYGNDGARGYGKNQYREYVQKRPSGDQ